MKKDIIIGFNGMIGKAIYECYGTDKNKVLQYDLDSDESILISNKDNIRCMHICFPCKDKEKFIDAVLGYIKITNPEIIIIHSTIPMGTTRETYKQTKKTIVVHSPCVGKHPDIYESIKSTFTKFYGVLPNTNKSISIVNSIMKELFESFIYRGKPENTEMAKILSTTEYAIHIAIATEFKRYCKENNLNFDFVYTEWRKNYNRGYSRLEDIHFVRPILTPCKGKILGHCICENLKLLERYMKKTWLTKILPKRLIR